MVWTTLGLRTAKEQNFYFTTPQYTQTAIIPESCAPSHIKVFLNFYLRQTVPYNTVAIHSLPSCLSCVAAVVSVFALLFCLFSLDSYRFLAGIFIPSPSLTSVVSDRRSLWMFCCRIKGDFCRHFRRHFWWNVVWWCDYRTSIVWHGAQRSGATGSSMSTLCTPRLSRRYTCSPTYHTRGRKRNCNAGGNPNRKHKKGQILL